MDKTVIISVISIILLLALIYCFNKLSTNDAVYVKSNLDNKEYLVQNLDDKDEATYILSVVYNRIQLLKKYLQDNINKYPEYKEYINQFCNRIKKLTLQENSPSGNYTSYTVNKGDEIALCLRSKNTGELHDINLVMYVVLHELAHVACPEIDHTPLFKKIFVFFLKISIYLKIYKKVDYQINPHEYCGLIIRENLLK